MSAKVIILTLNNDPEVRGVFKDSSAVIEWYGRCEGEEAARFFRHWIARWAETLPLAVEYGGNTVVLSPHPLIG